MNAIEMHYVQHRGTAIRQKETNLRQSALRVLPNSIAFFSPFFLLHYLCNVLKIEEPIFDSREDILDRTQFECILNRFCYLLNAIEMHSVQV